MGGVAGAGLGQLANDGNQTSWSKVLTGNSQNRGRQQFGGQRNGAVSTQNKFSLLSSDDSSDSRSRSSSKKRKSEDGSPVDADVKNSAAVPGRVKKPTRPAPKCGTGGAGGGGGLVGRVADFLMYVGRTHPDTTETDIRALVKEYTTTQERPDGVKLTSVVVLKEMKDDQGLSLIHI